MNYVLYVIGTLAIVAGVYTVARVGNIDNAFADMILIYVSGSFIVSGILFLAFGSGLGLLKKIVRNTTRY
jgi:hypothetical protein